jgi:hypothetical protein
MLLIVFLLVDNNVSVDEDIVEEEKLPGFGLFTTSFGKDSFTNQNSSGNVEAILRELASLFTANAQR